MVLILVQNLNATEEVELSTFLQQCACIGYGKTRRDVHYIAQSTAEDKGVLKGAKISHGWWRFLQRQGNLSLRKGDSASLVRFNAINEETTTNYFALLK